MCGYAANMRAQKREKTERKKSKSKKAAAGRGGGREGRQSLLEEEDPVWSDQLHSQLMY